MPLYRISYRQTEYRHATVEAESEAAAQAKFEEHGEDDDEFDMAENTVILEIEER